MTELIDIFNANHERIGVCDQASVHRQGLWHQTFHCWIVSCHDDAGYLLLQLRSATKKDHPNTLDVTAAGHLAAGEQALDGLRELEEELGVSTAGSNLRYLGIKHDIMDGRHGIRNREFAHVYILRDDRPIEKYRLQAEEVSGLVEVSIEDGLALFAGEVDSVAGKAVRVKDGVSRTYEQAVMTDNLIPRVDSYYLKIFILAKLYLAGYRYLSI